MTIMISGCLSRDTHSIPEDIPFLECARSRARAMIRIRTRDRVRLTARVRTGLNLGVTARI